MILFMLSRKLGRSVGRRPTDRPSYFNTQFIVAHVQQLENSKTTGWEVGWVGESVGCLSAGVTSPLLQRPFRLRKLNSL